jgi:hypothetical protein
MFVCKLWDISSQLRLLWLVLLSNVDTMCCTLLWMYVSELRHIFNELRTQLWREGN